MPAASYRKQMLAASPGGDTTDRPGDLRALLEGASVILHRPADALAADTNTPIPLPVDAYGTEGFYVQIAVTKAAAGVALPAITFYATTEDT